MNPKREHILESAMRCFAAKGYHASSIQEIAEEAGIAKGLVYFYFKSKEDLLLSALQHFYDKMGDNLAVLRADGELPPRDRLHAMLCYLFEHSRENREFLLMMMSEQAGKTTERLTAFLIEARVSGLQRLMDAVTDIYGDQLRPYALDAAIVLQAMLMEFMFIYVFDPETTMSAALATFMLERLDEMTEGMLRKQRPPLLDAGKLDATMAQFQASMGGRPSGRQAALMLRKAIDNAGLDDARRKEALACAEVIDGELAKTDGSKVVVRGMIACLRDFGLEELREPLAMLEGTL